MVNKKTNVFLGWGWGSYGLLDTETIPGGKKTRNPKRGGRIDFTSNSEITEGPKLATIWGLPNFWVKKMTIWNNETADHHRAGS